MVNQQLKDYVNEQLRVGVSRDAIKSALLEAGWVMADVNEALGMPQMNVVAKAAPVSVKPQAASAMNGVKGPIAVSIPAARVVAAPKTIDVKRSFAAPSQKPVSFADVVTNPRPAMKLSLAHRVAHAVMGIAILALGGAGTWLFLKSTNLAAQVGMLTNDKEGVVAELGTLKAEKGKFETQMQVLQLEKKEFEQALSIFVAPSGTIGAVQEIAVEGILSLGTGALPYTLAMPAGITLTLKNSRDAVVEPVLKPLVGANILILGRHTLGSKDITVLQVNGAPVDRSAPPPRQQR